MPLSKTDQMLSEHNISAAQAHLETTAPPMTPDVRVLEKVRHDGADHAQAVIKTHVALINELTVQGNVLFSQIYGFDRRIEALHGEQQRDIGQPHRDQFRHNPSIPPTSAAERERGRRLVEEYPLRIAAQIADAVEQRDALAARRAAISARLMPLGGRVKAIYTRVRRSIGGEALPSIAPPAAGKLTLDAARARVEQPRAEARKLAAAPRTAGEVKQLITEWAALKTKAPAIVGLFDPQRIEVDVFLPGIERDGQWFPDPLGLALWTGGDAIVKRLHAEADRMAAPDAIDAGTRAKKLAEWREQHLAALRAEEAVAFAALQAGEPVVLRAIPDDNDALPWPLADVVGDHVRAILSLA
jgi:hypothetical protein